MHQLLSSKQPEPQVTFPVMLGHVTIIVQASALNLQIYHMIFHRLVQ